MARNSMTQRTGQPDAARCAIYTRKSSEDGLEQTFNSLDAQREACLAYITSQRHEGWKALPTLYDDGGFSGGTLNRPALHRLLADIRAGRIDQVVIYKVDRLTPRSPTLPSWSKPSTRTASPLSPLPSNSTPRRRWDG
jgi:site-specific DNA recombinase